MFSSRSASLFTASLFLALSASADAQIVRDAARINTNGLNLNGANSQDGVALAAQGSRVYAVWAEQFATNSGTQDIYLARSVDDGLSFDAPVRVDLGDAENATDSDFAKIAVADNGNLVVVWEEKRDAAAQSSGNEDIFYNLSTDGGLTWMAASLPLNTNTAGADITSDIDRIWLAASGNTFHVTWEEDAIAGAGGAEEVVYTRSTDAGLTWSTPVIVSPATGTDDVDDPKVAADGDLVIITYVDVNDDLAVVRSTDGGATFSAPFIAESDLSGNVDEPQLEVKGQTVLIGWNEEDPNTPAGEGVHCVVSQDGGLTWLPEVTLSLQHEIVAGSDTDIPQVFIESADELYVVYDEDSQAIAAGMAGGSGANNCYLAYSKDGGATWTSDVPISLGTVANRPEIVVTAGVVVVNAELDANGANTLAFFVSEDGGASFLPLLNVPSSGPDSDFVDRNECTYMVVSEATNSITIGYLDNSTGANEVYAAGLTLIRNIGTAYCTVITNSTGTGARLLANGSQEAAANDFTLSAVDMPENTFGVFLASLTSDFSANPGGSAGNLCIGPNFGRGVGGAIVSSGAAGTFTLAADLTAIPTATGPMAVTAGDRVYFQAWFRDSVNGATTSNFSNGLLLVFE
ncbi:BNR/Asp-box repeat protein [Planctomycetes bacterium Poly30]|uniref:exo-alpha-sialidase n=1 Tax=Saltatorellus ferox TaxID=2528018 RepID=A0A518ENH1_9BACT|nr:BNR/Asp-box repeat protein [Planctomycetes bacterium Poly30]